MLKIDSHQHFWQYDPLRHSWISEEMSAIRRDFLPGDLAPLLDQQGIDGCIAVQADQTYEENDFLLGLAGQHDFIKGVVGWIDLQAPDIDEQLQHLQGFPKLKGFRHVLQGEADRQLMLRPAFMNGISKLDKYGFTYDILIFLDQLPYAAELVRRFPDQPFVLDHIAKPDIKGQQIDEWRNGITELAQYENVCCKVSGMVTEANWENWDNKDFSPYLDVVFNAFGTRRLMYGSDWPVCQVAGTYAKVAELAEYHTQALSGAEQELFWGGNAAQFYKIN
ncbi:amidohydrolase family protein [Pedobacter sp. JY14-1]|uniref:amidohydrolase family protein n=1 Tax=Pedobacter sp. JY14-1 TaxID=3034151 RepID=UPI0023E11F08|nr:amidohydrolase family protein [Pedobacter sp. JY14-1]